MKDLNQPRLSNGFIDYHAQGMVKHLQKAGHLAYLVGGCVRDLLVGQMPKDFDIGTSALPQEVKKLISFSFIIGRRFRLVLVKRDDKQYEVSTFRREPQPDEFPEGVPFGDNIFGTPEQDAFRRDFTCNALFYDPVGEEVIDFVDGQADIERHLIKMIGDPAIRLKEDPIRILRALRFSHKLHFKLDAELREQMHACASSLQLSVLPRRREEYLKLLRLHDPAAVFREAYDLNIWETIAPELHKVYEKDTHMDLLEERLHRMDSRLIDSGDTALLFGTLVLAWLRATAKTSPDHFLSQTEIFDNAHLTRLTKDQLGLHNWEISRLTKALGIHRILADPEGFERRGHRRRMAFVLSESFPLAVDLAHIDALLEPDILDFWDAQLDIAREAKLNEQPQTTRPRPRRRRRTRH